MNDSIDLEVCIIGGGFAGMNLARLLALSQINCAIYTADASASQMWAGTVDLLKTMTNNISEGLQILTKDVPMHPFNLISLSNLQSAIDDFFSNFPEFNFSKLGSEYINQSALTALGTLKPCIGRWNSIFSDFDRIGKLKNVVIVEFVEFQNSAMDLVRKGLSELYPTTEFLILRLKIAEIFDFWHYSVPDKQKISLNTIANAFELNQDQISILGNILRNTLKTQYPKLSQDKIELILFPPVLGINNSANILYKLSESIGVPCSETLSLSPSLMATRLINTFEEKLKKLKVPINRAHIFNFMKKNTNGWEVQLENKGQKIIIHSKYVIFATGSLYLMGSLVTVDEMRKIFEPLKIEIPNKLTSSYELVTKTRKRTGVYVCGSATYVFHGGMSDEDEIKYASGLGLAIVTSWIVSKEIFTQT